MEESSDFKNTSIEDLKTYLERLQHRNEGLFFYLFVQTIIDFPKTLEN